MLAYMRLSNSLTFSHFAFPEAESALSLSFFLAYGHLDKNYTFGLFASGIPGPPTPGSTFPPDRNEPSLWRAVRWRSETWKPCIRPKVSHREEFGFKARVFEVW